MKTIVLNYAHPMTAVIVNELVRKIGDVEIVNIPCQLDFDKDIEQQLNNLFEIGAESGRRGNIVINPPLLAVAAGYICARFGYSPEPCCFPEPPRIMWLRRDEFGKFVFGGIVGQQN